MLHHSNYSRMLHMLLFVLLLNAVVSAQTFRGTILGTVTDPNGAVVSGAKISVKNTSTGLERSTTTDEAGNYTVPELPIGPYEVRIEQTGFVTSTVSNVIVEVASDRRVDAKLSVAGQCRRCSRIARPIAMMIAIAPSRISVVRTIVHVRSQVNQSPPVACAKP